MLLFMVVAFFAGSFPTAYVFGRVFFKTDIRKHGSGNVGATNAFRVLGKDAGRIVFAVDFLKGLLPALLFRLADGPPERALWIGLSAMLGHVFTPFLGFKGGKGVATGAGAAAAGLPVAFASALPVWLSTFKTTRIVSVSSLAALVAFLITAVILGIVRIHVNAGTVLCAFIMVGLVVWTHRENISRLKKGEEKKIS